MIKEHTTAIHYCPIELSIHHHTFIPNSNLIVSRSCPGPDISVAEKVEELQKALEVSE